MRNCEISILIYWFKIPKPKNTDFGTETCFHFWFKKPKVELRNKNLDFLKKNQKSVRTEKYRHRYVPKYVTSFSFFEWYHEKYRIRYLNVFWLIKIGTLEQNYRIPYRDLFLNPVLKTNNGTLENFCLIFYKN